MHKVCLCLALTPKEIKAVFRAQQSGSGVVVGEAVIDNRFIETVTNTLWCCEPEWNHVSPMSSYVSHRNAQFSHRAWTANTASQLGSLGAFLIVLIAEYLLLIFLFVLVNLSKKIHFNSYSLCDLLIFHEKVVGLIL